MTCSKLLLLLLWLEPPTRSLAAHLHLSRNDFSKILYTALDDEATLQHLHHQSDDQDNVEDENDLGQRRLDYENDAWDRMVQHGWSWSKRKHNKKQQRNNQHDNNHNRRNLRSAHSIDSESSSGTSNDNNNNSPFVVCSTSPNQSGYERRKSIAASLDNVPMEHVQTVYNTEGESCFIVTTSANVVEGFHDQLQLLNPVAAAEEDGVEFDSEYSNITSIAEETNTTTSSSSSSSSNQIKLGPLFDVLKLPAGTAMSILSNDDWAPPSITSVADLASVMKRTVTNEFSYDNVTEEYDVDIRKWSRSFMVDLLPGSIGGGYGYDSVESVANEIVEYVKDMAQVPPSSSDNNGGASSSSTYLRSNKLDDATTTTSRFTAELPISTREAFSLTATHTDDDIDENNGQPHKRIFHKAHNMWSTALSKGFEAPHGCQVMLDTLQVRTRASQEEFMNEDTVEDPINVGFEVVLHPPSQFMKYAAVESSAWNKHCAISLLMGLSVHPLVQTVEVGQQVELASLSMSMATDATRRERGAGSKNERTGSDDVPLPFPESNEEASSVVVEELTSHNYSDQVEGITNPQWITQSGTLNSRPFFDVGLDGSGQVVAVADGGLDQDNCYFKDSSSSEAIYGNNGWKLNQRKIVHYDDSFGDRTEVSGGHGTYVSSIVAGRRSTDGSNEVAGHADGTAPGSKLAFFDMEDGYFGIADPGVDRLLTSLYNPNSGSGNNYNGKGARVINASWGRSYNGQYTTFCKEYDQALRSKFPDLLFVVSAGNTGRHGVSSIQDPADCKSPLAVGSSLSYGSDIRNLEKGIEYLADYSSRGPAQDGRMKPDICAPGHFVLAAKADPNTKGECDGASEPDVKTNDPGGAGVKFTTGTSMAAPALAGAAAILRQYFEDGYCNASTGMCCGYKGCGSTVHPSGALMKAALMNGAQPLQGGIQYVPGGRVLGNQPLEPYDSNQGMGRVNLLNSVPLQGKNEMSMKFVNDEFIVNGEKNIYTVYADRSDGCGDELSYQLSATLAWYDAPGTVGCTACVVNDLDLSIKLSSGVMYPNGRNSRDEINTVERVQTSVEHGEQINIIVEAKNFASYSQKYSLAITGCFSENEPLQKNSSSSTSTTRQTNRPTKRPTKIPTEQPTKQPATPDKSNLTGSNCPESLFQLVMNTGDDGPHITWNLIASTANSSVKTVMSGSNYAKNTQYTISECLESNKRYRFQMRNTQGEDINGRYKLTYGGEVVFSSSASSQSLGKVSTVRFKTNGSGSYQALGSNSFKAHVQSNDETEILGGSSVDAGMAPPLYNLNNSRGNNVLKLMPKSIERNMFDDDHYEEEKEINQLEYEEEGEELEGEAFEHFPLSTVGGEGGAEVEDGVDEVGEPIEFFTSTEYSEDVDEDAENDEEELGQAIELLMDEGNSSPDGGEEELGEVMEHVVQEDGDIYNHGEESIADGQDGNREEELIEDQEVAVDDTMEHMPSTEEYVPSIDVEDVDEAVDNLLGRSTGSADGGRASESIEGQIISPSDHDGIDREEAVGEVMEHIPSIIELGSGSVDRDGEEDVGDAFEHIISENEDSESV